MYQIAQMKITIEMSDSSRRERKQHSFQNKLQIIDIYNFREMNGNLKIIE